MEKNSSIYLVEFNISYVLQLYTSVESYLVMTSATGCRFCFTFIISSTIAMLIRLAVRGICNIVLQRHISKLSNFFFYAFLAVHDSLPYLTLVHLNKTTILARNVGYMKKQKQLSHRYFISFGLVIETNESDMNM